MTDNKSEASLEEALKANKEFNEENERLKQELKEAKRQATLNKNKLEKLQSSKPFNSTRFEAEDQQVGQDGDNRFEGDELIKTSMEKLDEDILKGKMEVHSFMEEPVTVEIHDVSEENADHGFTVWVNGQPETFYRGQTKTVKRKFVEGLARARKTGYKCILKIDPQTGEQYYSYPSHTGLRYPFSVIDDANPKGRTWLKQTLRQP